MRYTTEQLTFLRKKYQTLTVLELTKVFNRRFGLQKSIHSIKNALNNHKIRCGGLKGKTVGKYRLLSSIQEDFVRDYFQEFTIPQTTRALNEEYGLSFTPQQIKNFCENHKIRSGRTGCFPKGNLPWNTGTKGMTGPNSGTFKKGDVPKNIKPMGHERLCRKDGFVLIKVKERNPHTGCPTRYKHKHVHVWEQHHGPVPVGMVVAFKDGDKLNCDPENLMLISRAELLRLNKRGYKDMPDELKPSVLAMAKLEVKMFERVRELTFK